MVRQSADHSHKAFDVSSTWDQTSRKEEVEGPDMKKGRVEEALEEGQGPHGVVGGVGGGGGGGGAEQNVSLWLTGFFFTLPIARYSKQKYI
jgi:hypothetical protein